MNEIDRLIMDCHTTEMVRLLRRLTEMVRFGNEVALVVGRMLVQQTRCAYTLGYFELCPAFLIGKKSPIIQGRVSHTVSRLQDKRNLVRLCKPWGFDAPIF